MTKIYMVVGYSLITGRQDIVDYVEAESEADACRKFEQNNPECEANDVLMEMTKEEFEECLEEVQE